MVKTAQVLNRTAEPEFLSLVPSSARARVESVQDAGIQLDRYGLTVPSKPLLQLQDKIAPTFPEGQRRIQSAIQDNRTIVFFPGAFDLVHVGHASYIIEGVEKFLSAVKSFSREDLFVVVALDSDRLIQSTKSGRIGEPPRPIQSQESFDFLLLPKSQHDTLTHPRALDMAGLPVDMVMTTPSPHTISTLLEDWHFKR